MRQRLLEHLKRHGPTGTRDLTEALGLSENAVRHHLHALERQGFVRGDALEHPGQGAGRPARLYALTDAAEGLFPKRYAELLELLLAEAEAQSLLEPLVSSLVRRLADQLRPRLEGLSGEARLQAALESLNLGGSLTQLEPTEGGWEVRAYNCPYLSAGCRFEAVCDLGPRVITLATGLPAERVVCQRDGERACWLSIGRA